MITNENRISCTDGSGRFLRDGSLLDAILLFELLLHGLLYIFWQGPDLHKMLLTEAVLQPHMRQRPCHLLPGDEIELY